MLLLAGVVAPYRLDAVSVGTCTCRNTEVACRRTMLACSDQCWNTLMQQHVVCQVHHLAHALHWHACSHTYLRVCCAPFFWLWVCSEVQPRAAELSLPPALMH
jgi:hypothetical protein